MRKSRNIIYITVFLLLVLAVWGSFFAMPSPKVVKPEAHEGDNNPTGNAMYLLLYPCGWNG